MSVLPTLIYRFSIISVQIPVSNFVDIKKLIQKYTWTGESLRIANTILKNNKIGVDTALLHLLQTYSDQDSVVFVKE